MTLMAGKRGLIFGLANKNSLAWGIAKHLFDQKAELAFTYQSERFKNKIQPLANEVGSNLLFHCDVAQEGHVEKVFSDLSNHWKTLDFVVHAISFSDKEELRNEFLPISRANFLNTMLISCYSFIDIAHHASLYMPNGGSILTLSYYGAEKVIPHYNIMGVTKSALETSVRYACESLGKQKIRVNTLSSGPIKTLAASGIGDFRYILKWSENNAPLRQEVTIDDVGKTAVYLLSDLSSAVTGETIHVDAGYHVVGMKAVDSVDLQKNITSKVKEDLSQTTPKTQMDHS